MSGDIPVNIIHVNAYGLEPGKVYLIEVDHDQVSDLQVRGLMEYLHKMHIEAVLVKSRGGEALRIVEPTPEAQP